MYDASVGLLPGLVLMALARRSTQIETSVCQILDSPDAVAGELTFDLLNNCFLASRLS